MGEQSRFFPYSAHRGIERRIRAPRVLALPGKEETVPFFDIHSHMLSGVDDGAQDDAMMYAMLDMAYEDGTRALCLTPHYSPYLFGDTFEASQRAFERLEAYAAEKYPDLRLFLGHELGFFGGASEALASGHCRTLGGTRYVLVDFPQDAEGYEIKQATERLLALGYKVILAHVERYTSLYGELDWLAHFVFEKGGRLQINASSITGAWGNGAKKQCKKLLKSYLVQFIGSDGHNLTTRPPLVSVCMGFLNKHCEEEYVADLVWNNAMEILQDK